MLLEAAWPSRWSYPYLFGLLNALMTTAPFPSVVSLKLTLRSAFGKGFVKVLGVVNWRTPRSNVTLPSRGTVVVLLNITLGALPLVAGINSRGTPSAI